jgi:hypothetical protein
VSGDLGDLGLGVLVAPGCILQDLVFRQSEPTRSDAQREVLQTFPKELGRLH